VAQPYISGPVSLWIRHSALGTGTPVFLGHGERAPQIQHSVRLEDFVCDISGSMPLDACYAGMMAHISVTLVRYNMIVLQLIEARARSSTFPVSLPGIDLPGQIGTLVVIEQATYELWLRHDGAAKPFMQNPANGVMPLGYHYFAATLDTESLQGGSVTPFKATLPWKCYRVPDFKVTNLYGTGAWQLFDYDMSAVAGLPIN
jgi:hypothetical protein